MLSRKLKSKVNTLHRSSTRSQRLVSGNELCRGFLKKQQILPNPAAALRKMHPSPTLARPFSSTCMSHTGLSSSRLHTVGRASFFPSKQNGKNVSPHSPLREDKTFLTSEKRSFFFGKKTKPKVIIITGPTAVGKTQTATRLAQKLNGQIISADSAQIYRGMDIGSDKKKDLTHLIDILEPNEHFSAGRWTEAAVEKIDEIVAKGQTPIVCGGSSFYIDWLVYGRPGNAPRTNSYQTEVEFKELGWTQSLEKYRVLDPEGAQQLDAKNPNDFYRLARAYTVSKETGKPFSSFRIDKRLGLEEMAYDFRPFCLTIPRVKLYETIFQRCEEMFLRGFLGEVHNLRQSYPGFGSTPGGSKIGYREVNEYLEAGQFNTNDFLAMVTLFCYSSRQYAHRQLGWARNHFSLVHWIDRPLHDEATVDYILKRIEEPHQPNEPQLLTAAEKSIIQAMDVDLKIFDLKNPYLPGVLTKIHSCVDANPRNFEIRPQKKRNNWKRR